MKRKLTKAQVEHYARECEEFAKVIIAAGYAYLRGRHGRALARGMLGKAANGVDQLANQMETPKRSTTKARPTRSSTYGR